MLTGAMANGVTLPALGAVRSTKHVQGRTSALAVFLGIVGMSVVLVLAGIDKKAVLNYGTYATYAVLFLALILGGRNFLRHFLFYVLPMDSLMRVAAGSRWLMMFYAIGALMVFYDSQEFRRALTRRSRSLTVVILAYTVWSMITIIWSSEPYAGFTGTIAVTVVIIAYIAPSVIFPDLATLRVHLEELVVGAVVLTAVALLWHLTGDQLGSTRVGGAKGLMAAGDTAMSMGHPALCAYYLWKTNEGRRRTWLIVAFAVLVFGLILTLYRSEWVVVGLGTLAIEYYTVKARTRSPIGIFARVAAISVLVMALVDVGRTFFYTGNQLIDKRLAQTTSFQDNPDAAFGGRFTLWLVGLQMFKENPVGGIGAGAYPKEFDSYAPRTEGIASNFFDRECSPHSFLVRSGAESGIIGFFLYLGVLIVAFQIGWRARREGNGLGALAFGWILGWIIINNTCTMTGLMISFGLGFPELIKKLRM